MGGKTTAQRRSAAPEKLGLAQIRSTQNKTRSDKYIILQNQCINRKQVRMDPTISHPNCRGRSQSAYYDDVQQSCKPQQATERAAGAPQRLPRLSAARRSTTSGRCSLPRTISPRSITLPPNTVVNVTLAGSRLCVPRGCGEVV